MPGPTSRVLKKGSPAASAAVTGAEELLAVAQSRARELVEAAEAEARRLRTTAEAEAREARAMAVAEGLAEGRGRAASLLALAAQARDAMLAGLDGAVAEAAIEVARRILEREPSIAPGAVTDVARRALRASAGCGDVVLRVAPADVPSLRAAEDGLRALIEGGALVLLEDATLAAGEVVAEATGGRVDARVEAQLEAFRKALAGAGA